MGGKALNKYGVFTERKSTIDFLRIAEYFQNKLKNDLGIETHVVKYFKEKETHGDLDLLLKSTGKNINIRKYIEDNIKTKAIHSNGSVISFEYENFQIDFISIKKINWEVAKDFFDYDPSGNLMGKVAHKFGLKYGIDGLMFPIRSFSGRLNDNITISKDSRKIFEFLGFNYDMFLKGFNKKLEIFDWAIESKYFNNEIFDFENLNNVDRKRNRKRATYNEFLEYLKIQKIQSSFYFKDKSEYIDMIDNFFSESNLKQNLIEFKKLDDENKLISEKFNGKMIMDKYEYLKGKELGNKIKEFKNSFEDFRNFVLNSSEDDIMYKFDNFLKC